MVDATASRWESVISRNVKCATVNTTASTCVNHGSHSDKRGRFITARVAGDEGKIVGWTETPRAAGTAGAGGGGNCAAYSEQGALCTLCVMVYVGNVGENHFKCNKCKNFVGADLFHALAQSLSLQGYLAHKKTLTPLGPPYDPTHRPTVGSYEGLFCYERGSLSIPPSLGLYKFLHLSRSLFVGFGSVGLGTVGLGRVVKGRLGQGRVG